MNKPWKVILAFLGVFLAGAVFGGFLSVRLAQQFRPEPPAGPGAPGGQFSPQIMKRLTQRLELTPEQQEKIRPIIQRTDESMRALRRDNLREGFAVAERMKAEVAALLTPAQQARLDQMHREMRERIQRERQQRWGERPPLPPRGERPGEPSDPR